MQSATTADPPACDEGIENIVYCSPNWFGEGKNSLLCSAQDKSWLVFDDTITFWDKYGD